LEDVRHLLRSGAAQYQRTATSWAMKVCRILCSAVVQHSILVVLSAAGAAVADAAEIVAMMLHEWLKCRDGNCLCVTRHIVPDSSWLLLLQKTQ